MSDNPPEPTGDGPAATVFARLQLEIVDRVRPPGSRLVEDRIAKELGTSRTPVRDALRMLSRAGLVETRRHAGAVVRQPQLDEVRDVFHMRNVLEPEAAELSAAHASNRDLERVHVIVERGNAAVGSRDLEVLPALNAEFHQALGVASGNKVLRRFIDELSLHARWHFSAVASNRAADSWREHAEILTAVESNDADLAGRLSSDHCLRTHTAYVETFLGKPIISSRRRDSS